MTERDQVYWSHIRDCIERIREYSKSGKEEFIKNSMVHDAVVRQLQILGEAVKKLGESEKKKFPHIPWKNIAGMRDKIVHDYFEIDLDLVWEVVDSSLEAVQDASDKARKKK